MNPSELLDQWAWTRRRAEAWLAMFDDDPERVVRACGSALAAEQDPETVLAAVLAAGAFELAELLLLDERFGEFAGPARLAACEDAAARARTAALNSLEVDLGFILARARDLGVEGEVDAQAIRETTALRREDGRRLLALAEQRVRDVETARGQALSARLDAVARPAILTADAFEAWQANVHRALGRGDFEAAEAALAQGPTTDCPPMIVIPEPAWWPYGAEPLADLLAWFCGDASSPPAFVRYIPHTNDLAAREFLIAARRWSDDGSAPAAVALLRGFAALLSCGLDVLTDGPIVHVTDLSAPGFHAFGRRRWPNGVPVELDAHGAFLVHFEDHALRLSMHDLLAVLHDTDGRRTALLAALGRQLPLAQAFASMLADESVRWERNDIDLPREPGAAILISAPGMGNTTLLHELAAAIPGSVVMKAPSEPILPEVAAIFLDQADRLDPAALRALVREIHWVRTTRQPPPTIVLSGRPELRSNLGTIPKGIFSEHVLPPRSLAALREQARVTLAWVGIHVARPGIHDRMAWLACGNPTILLFLCRAIARQLADQPAGQRRVDDAILAAAWQSDELRASTRDLLWDPANRHPGVPDVIRAIHQVEIPGRPLHYDELEWVLEGRDAPWIAERIQLLASYGLIRIVGDSVHLWPGGLAQLVSRWLEE